MANNKTMYVVSHSHWDREWYLSHAKHNFNLVRTMDKLIEVLENDDGFKTFHLDGQIIILDDYLAVRPSMAERVKKLIANGKLKVGPLYILQDDYLLSGEANVRNALVGIRETKKYGNPTMIGYFPDTFGNIGQMPQILKGVGIDNAFMGRGPVISNPEKVGKTDDGFAEFTWVAPDGSEVIAEQFIYWYSSGMELPEEEDALNNRLGELLTNMSACTKTSSILLLNGCDHQPVQANLSKVIEKAKKLGYDIKHTSLEDFLESVRPYRSSFAPVVGEINQEESDGYRTLRETASARIYLKQSSYRAGYLLESVAEPLGLLGDKNGLLNDEEMFHYAWKCLLENYPHDSICGCSVDEVHRKMEVRFAETIDTVQSQIDLTGDRLVAKLCGSEKTVLVCNCYAKPVTDYVEVKVDYKEGETIPQTPILYGDDGSEYYPVVEDLGEMTVFELPEDKFRQVFNVHRFIYRIYGTFAPAKITALTVKDGSKEEEKGVWYGDGFIENSLVKITFNKNGSFNITDKNSGKNLKDQNVYTEIGDKGNEYEFMPTGNCYDTSNDIASIVLDKADSQAVTFKVTNNLMQQNGKYVEIESKITLYAHKKGVRVSLKFNNECKDHRIRADFAWGTEFATHNSAGQFDLTKRNNCFGSNWKAPHHPQRTYEFIERLDGKGNGSVLALRGHNEYEVLADNGHTQITLVRGVGILGDWFDFYTYDSQCLREVTAEYMVEFYVDGEREMAIDEAYSFHKPRLYAFAGNGKGEKASDSAISVSGNVVVSCLRMNENGENVLRIFNPYEVAQEVKFSKEVCVTDMREQFSGEKITQTTLAPKKILTVKFN
ncbi:MAG: hypothetical protein E7360_04805 [Clostridiales bacterium]|nr:hypothetical protein [Clostridiales bacterium]